MSHIPKCNITCFSLVYCPMLLRIFSRFVKSFFHLLGYFTSVILTRALASFFCNPFSYLFDHFIFMIRRLFTGKRSNREHTPLEDAFDRKSRSGQATSARIHRSSSFFDHSAANQLYISGPHTSRSHPSRTVRTYCPNHTPTAAQPPTILHGETKICASQS